MSHDTPTDCSLSRWGVQFITGSTDNTTAVRMDSGYHVPDGQAVGALIVSKPERTVNHSLGTFRTRRKGCQGRPLQHAEGRTYVITLTLLTVIRSTM
jgi:hypothetical protein